MAEECIFCQIIAKQIPAKLVHEDADCIAFRDINPQAPKHLLLVPRRHIRTANDLEAEDAALVGRLVLVAQKLAAAEGLGEGYRLVLNCGAWAGQTVWHLHLHLLGGRPMHWPPG